MSFVLLSNMSINEHKERYSNLISDIKSKKKRTINFLGEKIVINKNVFPVDSDFSYSSKVTAKRIPKNAGVILDVGTGTGVQAIIAAKKGASKVVAIDIDSAALENAEENITLNKMKKIVDVRKSNLFNNVDKKEKFDLIISNLPFADSEYGSDVDHFLFDKGFKLHDKFLHYAKNHLKENGKIFIPSGDAANEKKLNELIRKYNYNIVRIYCDEFQGLIWKLYVLKY